NVTIANIQAKLAEQLPEYMVPSHFVLIDKMPLTLNGKRDQQALLRLVKANIQQQVIVHSPHNAIEEAIHAAWCTVFETGRIDTQQNFFALGGDSLKATLLVVEINRISSTRGLAPVMLKDLYESPTIQAQARLVGEQGTELATRNDADPLEAATEAAITQLPSQLRSRWMSKRCIQPTLYSKCF
ncbi:hypothetical protein LCGC14_2450630, partial [marine sediment metagenome]